MKEIYIARLLRRVALTHDHELDCGECSLLTPQFVDALLDGQDGLDKWVLVKAHLEQCSTCAQEVVTLRNVVMMDAEGSWPSLTILVEWATRGEARA